MPSRTSSRRQLRLGDDHAGDAARCSDRQVDLADQEDEDDAVASIVDAGHLRMMFVKFPAP